MNTITNEKVTNEKITNENNIRLTEINTYYGDNYNAYIEILKIIVFFSLCILIISIIKNMELIPDFFLNGIMGIFLIVGLFYSLWLSYDISLRDNINFSEYNWKFNKPATSKNSTTYQTNNNIDNIDSNSFGIECIGMQCCSNGMIFDSTINKCVDKNKNNKEGYDTYNYMYEKNNENKVVSYGI